MFGANDLKLAYEFQSALYFLMFNLKYDVFSEKFGKIKFPIDKEIYDKNLHQYTSISSKNAQSSVRLSRLSNARRQSFDHRVSTFNNALNTSENYDADQNKE